MIYAFQSVSAAALEEYSAYLICIVAICTGRNLQKNNSITL
jgi:hypothetical protein